MFFLKDIKEDFIVVNKNDEDAWPLVVTGDAREGNCIYVHNTLLSKIYLVSIEDLEPFWLQKGDILKHYNAAWAGSYEFQCIVTIDGQVYYRYRDIISGKHKDCRPVYFDSMDFLEDFLCA